MPTDSFVHLHVASGWSLRHGANHPDQLVAAAADHGMAALALTDRDGVRGAVRFVRACMAVGIAPILGADLAVSDEPVTGRMTELTGVAKTPARGGRSVDPRRSRVTVIARDSRGWAALCRLISAAHTAANQRGERGRPVIDHELLATYAASGGLVVLLGPDSAAGRALARRRPDLASTEVHRWREFVPTDLLRIEIVNHRGADPTGRSASFAARMVGLAHETKIPAVLTNAVRYVHREDAPIADVLDAIRRLVALDARHVDRRTGEGYLKNGRQMAQVANEVSRLAGIGTDKATARRLLDATASLADECVLDPVTDLGIGSVHFPEL
ncbi:MAG: PHP domain-containing protein, partial [Candidatus Nanopelagicales bacterium]